MNSARLQAVARRAFPGPSQENQQLRIVIYETAAAGVAASWASSALYWAKRKVWTQLLGTWPSPMSAEALLAVAEASFKRAWNSCRKAREAIAGARLERMESQIARLDVQAKAAHAAEKKVAFGG